MELMELQTRIAEVGGRAMVRIKLTGAKDTEETVELTCVEVVTGEHGQVVILSDERGG